MMVLVTVILAGLVAAVVVAVAVLGWGGQIVRFQRYGLCAIAAGLVWAGPARALGIAPGAGDLQFLIGLLAYLLATHGPPICRRLDALDGKPQGGAGRALDGWRYQRCSHSGDIGDV